jgi:hypothetical protein
VSRRLLLLTAILTLVACGPEAEPDPEPEDEQDPVWQAFTEARVDHLQALSVPIADCVVQEDTGWPAFHGCIDWHSAVHATWSLHALARFLDDDSFLDLADDTLDPESVTLELDLLEAGGLDWDELPYGFSWFLALARERERSGMTDLAPLGDEVAGRLEDHVFTLTATGIDEGLLAAQYDNLSWELLNLWAWAHHVGDAQLEGLLEDFVRSEVVPRTGSCPVATAPDNTYNFFPPCLHLARLVVTVLPEAEAADWLADQLTADFDLSPIDDVPSWAAHRAGLNFSRAWGLWSLYEASGDLLYRDLYIELIEAHVAMPEYWAEGYQSYSHWVAQFGVYAIALGWDQGEVP